jgi:hypothetical protein
MTIPPSAVAVCMSQRMAATIADAA